jgi:hypothetical protein
MDGVDAAWFQGTFSAKLASSLAKAKVRLADLSSLCVREHTVNANSTCFYQTDDKFEQLSSSPFSMNRHTASNFGVGRVN